MNPKEEKLLQLAKKRQRKTYEGYSSIGDFNNGAYECDYISPYSISSHNVDTKVLVILQDWCSEESFDENVCEETLKYGFTPSVRTNINLQKLLEEHFHISLNEAYATNLFPYIKKGSMSASIPQKDLVKAAKEFTLPAMQIIRPTIAICLGLDTFNAIRIACGKEDKYPMDKAINSSFEFNGTTIFAQAHTGQMGINNRNRGGVERVSGDWKKMAEHLQYAYNNRIN
tara:strand:- start:21138 stop:21821 length:684 start_codon:yes stop_codon:yes gene_type:complete